MTPKANLKIPLSLRRRDMLRGAAGALAIFPFLRRAAEAATPPTPRLILLMQTNGTSQASFWPTSLPTTPAAPPLTSPILQALAGDPQIAPAMTLIKGIGNEMGGAGNGHDFGFAGLYSGYKTIGSFTDPWGSGASIDQYLKKTLTFNEPFPSLHCGVTASDTPPFKKHRRSFSYSSPDRQVSTEIDPYRLYARYFSIGVEAAPGTSPTASAMVRLSRRKTVLDYVKSDLDALRPRLSQFDAKKLDDHATAVRELETNLTRTLSPDPNRPALCGNVSAPETRGIDVRAEDNVPDLIKLMFDFIPLALACQLTRIVTFQFGNGGEKWYYRWLDINENSHDDIAHRDSGKDPVITEKVVRINQWYVELIRGLCQRLIAMPDGNGTLFDNTLVVWGNELATGPHGMRDIPIALLGRAGGRIPPTALGTLVNAGVQDYHRLGCSLLRVMGLPAVGFGDAPACGPVMGLGV